MKTSLFIPLCRDRGGFALIATISILVLLALIAVGLLSLSSVTVRAAAASSAQLEAQANARMALIQAIGQLQKHLGPDRRVTATGSITGEDVAQPHWMGVWSNQEEGSLPIWLVSGNETVHVGDLDSLSAYPGLYHEPDSAPAKGFEIYPETANAKAVEVPLVEVNADTSRPGRYAWWISDEGTKARVDLQAPDDAPETDTERMVRSRVSQEPNFSEVDHMLKPLSDPASDFDKKSLVSYHTLDLALGDREVGPDYAHDLTVGGYGLPIDVVKSGTKTDLSVLFDTSQEGNQSVLTAHLGATPTEKRITRAFSISEFPTVTNPDVFFLAPELRESSDLLVGPNWGNLYNYGRLWNGVQDGVANPFSMNPGLSTDLRTNHWPPYQNHQGGVNNDRWRRDVQHTNSSLSPVLTMMQIGFRISARSGVPIPNTKPPVDGYQVVLQMKPVLGFWNPYNVKLKAQVKSVQWGLFPFIRIAANTPAVPRGEVPHQAYNKHWIRADIWMRDHWMQGGGVSTATTDGSRLKLTTQAIDFEPGEFRLFSVVEPGNLRQDNPLVPEWGEDGVFNFDLNFSEPNSDKEWYSALNKKFIVPRGSGVWFGGAYLEDTVLKKTREYYGSSIIDGVSASYITVGGGSAGEPHDVAHRVSDIWQGMTQSSTEGLYNIPKNYLIPEPIISEWGRTGKTSPIPVELLARTPTEIGTWRFFSRTTTEAYSAENDAGSQRIRSWIDSNPRFGPANPAWDGSRIAGNTEEGLHFISPFIGGSYGESYDGGPRGRGKVAEGQAPPEPEVDHSGRYRGFGGLSTSSNNGQTHVPLFDVPRAPLVSLGQFQHAQLARYHYEPAFAFGNSHASMRIPLDQTHVDNYAGVDNFRMLDLSHAVNESVWDGYFFSTIGIDYNGPGQSGSLDTHFPMEKLLSGEIKLANPRHRFVSPASGETFDEMMGKSDGSGPKAISATIAIEGAFNVNSTSKAAWKAVLASMANFEFPVLSQDGSSVSWETEGGFRFPRFGHVMQKEGWESSGSGSDPGFWNGFRELSAGELDELAENIVKEVRERGPFRSFAEFVNRDPQGTKDEHKRSGALQTALDKSVNAALVGGVGDKAEQPQGEFFVNAMGESDNTAAGYSGYMMQGDLLQSLAPILQVRSDFFRIRTVGQSVDTKGTVLATAVCEAQVQRVVDYVEPEDAPHLPKDELRSEANKAFGRRFKLVSFRWLSPDEI